MDRKAKSHKAQYLKRQAKKIKRDQNLSYSEALNESAKILGFENWNHFLNNSNKASTNQKINIKHSQDLPRPLVLTYRSLVARNGAQRPNAKMPVSNHLKLGALLKEIRNATDEFKRARNPIASICSTLDDWIQCEYTTQKELSDEVFFQIYYGSHEANVEYSPSIERKEQLIKLCLQAKAILSKSYHDCRPLRDLYKRLDLAIKWIKNWPEGRKQKGIYSVRGKIAPGTIVRVKSHRRLAIVIEHNTRYHVVECYDDSGSVTLERNDISVLKEQPKIFKFRPMRLLLPYGKWTCSNKTEVLFNRDYCPLWVKDKDKKVFPIDPDNWIDYETVEFYFSDATAPWSGDKNGLGKSANVLKSWDVVDRQSTLMKLFPEAIATGDIGMLKPKNILKVFSS